ncbi:MAG: ABC transporter permease [Lachnospiraceae bacterium]|nr:ABC transporter permease [Lachnospiraceae bacterium]
MENYRELAFRYLKHNKRRSMLTVAGVSVCVTVLYIILNLAWSYLLDYRQGIRKERDYEIVLFTESQEQIEQIMADSRVKDATVGRFYSPDYYNPQDYENAMYINTNNPYRMEAVLNELTERYQVEGEINNILAPFYMQGSTADIGYILILIVILVSYIIAIFGVGIIRNSIQLTMFEQIKDFGNLRCIGSSKGQLRAIIYIQGAVLEILGIVVGVIIGWMGSLIAGIILKWDFVGFHFAPIPLILIAFLFDLYFAMEENAKLVTKMTPVSAIRGEFRIKKEKLKRRRKSLWGLIFGVEGDYAYKNVRRHSGRFIRTVTAMSLGIAAAMLIFGVSRSLSQVVIDIDNMYGYYQEYFTSYAVRPNDSKEEMMKNLPPTELLEQMSEFPGLTDAKRVYENGALVTDFDKHLSHFTDDYKNNGVQGSLLDTYLEHEQEIKAGGESDMFVGNIAVDMYNIPCYGYDDDDMKRYKDVLADGTVDVSDHGIVLVNGGYSEIFDEYDREHIEYVNYSDYKVGDEIEFVDTGAFRESYLEKLKPVTEAYEENRRKEQEIYDSYGDDLTEEQSREKRELFKKMDDEEHEYNKISSNMICEVYNEMIEEGHTVTYTIEGIVKKDANYGNIAPKISIVMPLDNFYTLTGTDESWTNGMMYHFDKFPTSTYMSRIYNDDFYGSGYAIYLSLIDSFRNVFIVAGLVILFVVVISIFNIINTTASDLYLRRKELAQLRVLGVSRKGLYKLVLLEGIIQAILSSVIGILIGTGLGLGFFELIFGIWFGYHYVFPVMAMLLSVLATVLILCGAVYMPLKRLPTDVAADLATAGE